MGKIKTHAVTVRIPRVPVFRELVRPMVEVAKKTCTRL
jgi:hypothetical protein